MFASWSFWKFSDQCLLLFTFFIESVLVESATCLIPYSAAPGSSGATAAQSVPIITKHPAEAEWSSCPRSHQESTSQAVNHGRTLPVGFLCAQRSSDLPGTYLAVSTQGCRKSPPSAFVRKPGASPKAVSLLLLMQQLLLGPPDLSVSLATSCEGAEFGAYLSVAWTAVCLFVSWAPSSFTFVSCFCHRVEVVKETGKVGYTPRIQRNTGTIASNSFILPNDVKQTTI